MFGNPETTTGGRALKFYSSVRMEVRRIGAIKDGEQLSGTAPRSKSSRTKWPLLFARRKWTFYMAMGISREGDLLDLGVAQELVEKSGSWYSFGGERIGQGRENARAFLMENPAVADRIDAELRRHLG